MEISDFITEHFEPLADGDQKNVLKTLIRQLVQPYKATEGALLMLFAFCESTSLSIASKRTHQKLHGNVGDKTKGSKRRKLAIFYSCACMKAPLGEEDVFGVIDELEAAGYSDGETQEMFRSAIDKTTIHCL